jgi:hypothetical protein
MGGFTSLFRIGSNILPWSQGAQSASLTVRPKLGTSAVIDVSPPYVWLTHIRKQGWRTPKVHGMLAWLDALRSLGADRIYQLGVGGAICQPYSATQIRNQRRTDVIDMSLP